MKERPLLFTAPMIQALLREIQQSGTGKTQTRRVVNPQPVAGPGGRMVHVCGTSWALMDNDLSGDWRCPYGNPGDLLWCREKHSFLESSITGRAPQVWYWADGNVSEGDYTFPRPSIHMHRWASRITLYLANVRVERVQDISEDDAKAEGTEPYDVADLTEDELFLLDAPLLERRNPYRNGFALLWDCINAQPKPVYGKRKKSGKRTLLFYRSFPWGGEQRVEAYRGLGHFIYPNPWIWALTFTPVLANVDAVLAAPEQYGLAA